MLYAIVGLLILLADQFLKFWTVAHVELNAYPGIELIPGVLNLTYIKNPGIAFGLFGDKPMLRWVLLGLLVLFTAFVVVSLVTRYLRTGFARWTGVLLLTGLIGNGVDRAIYGYVVDMLEPKLGSISWPIFNIADALILVFGILFCIALLTGGFGAPRRRKASGGRQPRREHGQADSRGGRDARRTAAEGRPSGRPRPSSAKKNGRPHAKKPDSAGKRPAPRPESPAPEAGKPEEQAGHVTQAEVAETLRQNGIALRPAEDPIPEVTEEAPPVQTVARPAPKAEAAGKDDAPMDEPNWQDLAPMVETKSDVPKPSIEDMDLDSILAEFK